jgi:hypothetical protein
MCVAKLCAVLLIFLASPLTLLAAGGTCPSGANYLSLSNPTGAEVALSSFGITSCYYVAANGSDSNSGTSESTPWLHAPGMPNCSSNCLTLQKSGPPAGTGYIFRGGDTWHFGDSSDSPYTGGTWEWYTWSGSAGAYIYIGVDPSWYSGSSWARPILSADNPTSTSPVSSCEYQIAANPIDPQFNQTNSIVYLAGVNYLIFDDFEMTGLCWSTIGEGEFLFYSGASAGEGNVGYVENNYVHGWTHTTAGAQTGGTGIGTYSQNDGEVIRFNVIDGADSDPLSLQEWGQGSSGYDLEYNVTTSAGGTSIFADCHILHDNLFEYINQLNDDSGHSDVYFCAGEYAGGSSSPNIFYNNVFRFIGSSSNPYAGYILAPRTPSGQTDYFFNNVFHDIWDNAGGNNNAMCDQPGGGPLSCGTVVIFDSTSESGVGSSGPTGIVWADNPTYQGAITSVNNHWITNAGTTPSAVFLGPSLVTESNAVYQTLSAANSQGYTSTNDFSPTSMSGATITASGANETTSYCAAGVLHNAAAEAACVQGITGVSYNQTNHTVVYPAFPAVLRPATGAWNVGAFELGPLAQVAAPTNLVATAH